MMRLAKWLKRIKRKARKFIFWWKKWEVVNPVLHGFGKFIIRLDYPPTSQNFPRWGYGRPAHPGLAKLWAAQSPAYCHFFHRILAHTAQLSQILLHATGPGSPAWLNGWLETWDAAALYTMLVSYRPSVYLEIGSGHSTRFARRAIDDFGLPTRIISLDPQPRVEIEPLCDTTLRRPLEQVDLTLFDRLTAGDILFCDCSHRVFLHSDATVLLLDILPRLRAGVLVHFHDIFLPDDYPPQWLERYYNEQYLLAAYLLGGGRVNILLPNHWATTQFPDLANQIAALWQRRPGSLGAGNTSLWLQIEG